MLKRLPVLVCALVVLAGCGALQGAPNFEEAYGTVDKPCSASNVVTRCTAHVVVVNRGGEGIGHVTIGVPMTDSVAATAQASSARTHQTARCGAAIPDTPGGGYIDASCSLDLPAGKTFSADPVLLRIDFASASVNGSSSGIQAGGIATVILAVLAALVAVATLVSALSSRRRVVVAPGARQGEPASRAGADEDDSW